MFFIRVENRIDRLLNPEIDHAIAVIRQDNIDEILADVVHVAFHGGEDHGSLACRGALLFHERFEKAHRRFHRFG